MPKENGDKYGCEVCFTCGWYDINTSTCPVFNYKRTKTPEMGWMSCWEEKKGEMTIKEFVSKYISCKGCFQNCCSYIDDSAFIDPSENVDRSMIKEGENFLYSENGVCTYFDRKCSIYGQGVRPFLCRVYPLRIANNILYVDDWCVQGKKLLAAIERDSDLELLKDIASIREWMIDNVPPKLKDFWNSREEKLLGVRLGI